MEESKGMFDIHKLSASFVCIAALAGGAFCWAAPSDLVTVGNKQLGVTLDGSRNYCLSTVWVKGVEFPSGGAFPCFKLYDPAGKEASVPAGDSGWHANYSRFGNGVTVAYSRDGFSADVDYKISKGMITITVTPKVETAWKIRALTDDRIWEIVTDGVKVTSLVPELMKSYRHTLPCESLTTHPLKPAYNMLEVAYCGVISISALPPV